MSEPPDEAQIAESIASMNTDVPNRITDPIATQEEADGIRAGLEMRKSIPPADLTPVMEEALALDEARLAQWDAVQGHGPEPGFAGEVIERQHQAEAADGEKEAD